MISFCLICGLGMTFRSYVCDRNADELGYSSSKLPGHAVTEPGGSGILSLHGSSGYNTATSSELSRWSHTEVQACGLTVYSCLRRVST